MSFQLEKINRFKKLVFFLASLKYYDKQKIVIKKQFRKKVEKKLDVKYENLK